MSQNSIKNIGYTEERQIWKKFIWLTCCFSFNPKAERKDKYFLKQTTSTTTRTTKWAGLFYSKTKSCDADLSGHENISLTTFLSLHTNYITFDKMKKKYVVVNKTRNLLFSLSLICSIRTCFLFPSTKLPRI